MHMLIDFSPHCCVAIENFIPIKGVGLIVGGVILEVSIKVLSVGC